MIKKLIKDIIKGERGFNKGEGISPKRKVSPKRREYLQFPSFPKEENQDSTDF